MLPALPPTFSATRESLRALACYAVSPARKARTGRIGLRAHGGGIATPPFDGGGRIGVHGDRLTGPDGEAIPITTVAAAAAFLGIDLSPDPGVGHDLPPFEPHADLAVDHEASIAIGGWYEYAQGVLDRVASATAEAGDAEVSEAQLWPEHFDLAVVVTLAGTGGKVNVGFSPGDGFHDRPYVYVGPHDTAALDRQDGYWNAPFGAFLGYDSLADAEDSLAAAVEFIEAGLERARSSPPLP